MSPNGSAAQAPSIAPQQLAQQIVQINPTEVAQQGLAFLRRCSLMPDERGPFAVVEQMLQGIASGSLMLAPAPKRETAPGPGAN